MKQLILGGANSGKSLYAEGLALAAEKECIYLATAQFFDQEMHEKVAKHQARRGPEWKVVEVPICLADTLKEQDGEGRVILVDCLSLWITNCLMENSYLQQRECFIQCVKDLVADIILVSNEVGSGVVPLGELSRAFIQASGTLHQELAQFFDTVSLVVAGLPLSLK